MGFGLMNNNNLAMNNVKMNASQCTRVQTCPHTHTHAQHSHTHTHMHTRTHAHTHTCTHTHTHTHTPTGVQKIKDLADEVDQLTPRVVAAALDVKKTPSNRGTRQHLDSLRREWAGKVQELTGAIDDIIDPEDFMAVSGEGVNMWGVRV